MGAQSDFIKQLCTIKSVPELIKYKFESVVDIQRRGLTLNGDLAVEQKPVFAPQEQKPKEKDKFLDIGLESMDWKNK